MMSGDVVHSKWAWWTSIIAGIILYGTGMNLALIISLIIVFMVGIKYVNPYLDDNGGLQFPRGLIIGPVVLCTCFTIIAAIAAIILVFVWVPVVEPLIDEARSIITPITTLHPTMDTVKMLIVFYGTIIVARVYHRILNKILG